MSNLPVLDLTVSLFFFLFLFSLFLVAILEMINTFFNRRANALRTAINQVFRDPDNEDYAELICHHPLIWFGNTGKRQFPSYISASNFSRALIDVISFPETYIEKKKNPEEITSDVPHFNIPSNPMDSFRDGLARMKDSHLRRLLYSLSASASSQEELSNYLRLWYHDYMGKVSGGFKRSTRKLLFAISTFLVVFFYVDFFHLVIEHHEANFWGVKDFNYKLFESSIKEARISVDSMKREQQPQDPTALNAIEGELVTNLDSMIGQFKTQFFINYRVNNEVADEILKQGLPIGWHIGKEKLNWNHNASIARNIWVFLMSISGLIVSILGITQGATYLFESLNYFVNMRSGERRPPVPI